MKRLGWLCNRRGHSNNKARECSHSEYLLVFFYWFVDDHSGDRAPVLLLLRSINTLSGRLDRETVYKLLDREILDLAKMIGIIFLIDADHAARTCCIRSAQAVIELNDVGALGKRKMRDREMRIQRKHRHHAVTATQ